jgi:non-ribosomal peptide synthetase component F
VRTTTLGAFDHQETPYQKVVELFAAQRAPGVPPVYQLGFNYLTTGFNRTAATAEDDLMLEVGPREGRIEYNTALFDPATIDGIARDYADVLAAAVRDPQTPISRLGTVTPRPAGVATAPDQPTGTAAYVAPRTAAETLVAQVWTDVLGVEPIGAEDEFFALGGHSLLALRVIARISAAAGTDLTIQDFFADTTVAGVARAVEEALSRELDAISDDEARRLLAEERKAAG